MKHESSVVTYSNQDSLDARRELFELMQSYPGTPEEKERSLGLFLRGSLLARIFAIAEIYQRIVPLPGAVLDIGTWRGQTAVVCENLRAIFASAISDARWCSTDPVCMDAGEKGQGPDSCNLAACHGCALLPETSCEEFNRFLDRGLVIGTFAEPNLGYFSDFS